MLDFFTFYFSAGWKESISGNFIRNSTYFEEKSTLIKNLGGKTSSFGIDVRKV